MKDLIFQCLKCNHHLYVDKKKMKFIVNMPEYNCPSCGEEGYGNWIILGEGDYEKDYPKRKKRK